MTPSNENLNNNNNDLRDTGSPMLPETSDFDIAITNVWIDDGNFNWNQYGGIYGSDVVLVEISINAQIGSWGGSFTLNPSPGLGSILVAGSGNPYDDGCWPVCNNLWSLHGGGPDNFTPQIVMGFGDGESTNYDTNKLILAFPLTENTDYSTLSIENLNILDANNNIVTDVSIGEPYTWTSDTCDEVECWDGTIVCDINDCPPDPTCPAGQQCYDLDYVVNLEAGVLDFPADYIKQYVWNLVAFTLPPKETLVCAGTYGYDSQGDASCVEEFADCGTIEGLPGICAQYEITRTLKNSIFATNPDTYDLQSELSPAELFIDGDKLYSIQRQHTSEIRDNVYNYNGVWIYNDFGYFAATGAPPYFETGKGYALITQNGLWLKWRAP